jgi:hypothetical protein
MSVSATQKKQFARELRSIAKVFPSQRVTRLLFEEEAGSSWSEAFDTFNEFKEFSTTISKPPVTLRQISVLQILQDSDSLTLSEIGRQISDGNSKPSRNPATLARPLVSQLEDSKLVNKDEDSDGFVISQRGAKVISGI